MFLGGSTRKYIEIQPGTYAQTVYVVGNVPLTIYGSGSSPSDVVITLSQPADMSTSAYINQVHYSDINGKWKKYINSIQVNPDGSRYKEGDPAYNLYHSCSTKSTGEIGTTCSSIFWITAADAQIYNLQVTNYYTSNGVGQSVALKTDADKVRLSNLNLISRQVQLMKKLFETT